MVSNLYMAAELMGGILKGKASQPLGRRERGGTEEIGKMMEIDEYHRRVDVSDDGRVCIDGSLDLATATRSDDRLAAYPKLGEVIEEVIEHFRRAGGKLPAPQNRPAMEMG